MLAEELVVAHETRVRLTISVFYERVCNTEWSDVWAPLFLWQLWVTGSENEDVYIFGGPSVCLPDTIYNLLREKEK